MKPLNQKQREDLRHAALYFLAERIRLAFSAESLPRFLHRTGLLEAEPDVPAVEDALRFLVGMQWAEEIVDPMGATLTYRITAEGVRQHERLHQKPG